MFIGAVKNASGLLTAGILVFGLSACFHNSDSEHDEGHTDTEGDVVLNATATGSQGNGIGAVVAHSGSATAIFRIDHHDNVLSGSLDVGTLQPNAVHIHKGIAGMPGGVEVTLTDADSNGKWIPPTNTVLTAEEVEEYKNGEYYVNAHFDNNEELRAQLFSKETKVYIVDLTAVDGITSTGSGSAYLTVDHDGNAKAVVRESGTTSDVSSVHIHNRNMAETPNIVFALTQSTTESGLWQNAEAVVLDAQQLADLNDGHFYANVHTATNTNGELEADFVTPL